MSGIPFGEYNLTNVVMFVNQRIASANWYDTSGTKFKMASY